MKSALLLCVITWIGLATNAQQLYSIDASKILTGIRTGQLKMGDPGPAGKELVVNNRYLTLNGKPIIPVMGEMHFSRVPRDQWEDVILKMKACGVNIIATYVIWIHHEEIEGHFDWTDNKDLRSFIQLCARHGLWVYPRIGPWCHAEVRNGGLPDWLLLKSNISVRSNDPIYQHYAEEWYRQVSLQMKGLLYKDGGPVIGVQLENEYGQGGAGEPHILWLKQTARKYGIDVPLYTVTGWGNASVPPYEVVPLWGAYPDEPWADNLNRNTDCSNFQFSSFRNDEKIGNEVNKAKESYIDYSAYPFFTCEVGVGIENTDHRRLQIGSLDGLGLMMGKIGSGSNLAGYYMFAGGSNPHGILTSMEENREETGYWNTNPEISYDFQAAIRESGELNDCYYEIKKLHYFLNEFGGRLAPMEPVFPSAKQGFQYCVRAKDDQAFVFGINYCRHNNRKEQKDIQFSVQLKKETVIFPSRPVNIKDSSLLIWPVNFTMQHFLLKYSTAQPLCHEGENWIFIQDAADSPEFCFDTANIGKLTSASGSVEKKNDRYIVSGLMPGIDCVISLTDKKGNTDKVIVLDRRESNEAWLFNTKSGKHFLISATGMYMQDDDHLHLFGRSPEMKVTMLNEDPKAKGVFTDNSYATPGRKLTVLYKKQQPLYDAGWLQTSAVDSLDSHTILMHRFFMKEFHLDNPSKIKKATLLLATPSEVRVQLNNLWINQRAIPGALTVLDITGYTRQGTNKLLLDYPFESGRKAFAAKVMVEYYNTDRVEFDTDSSWLTTDAYTFPSYLIKQGKYKAPSLDMAPGGMDGQQEDYIRYNITLPSDYPDSLNNAYLQIEYTGNKARIYHDGQLMADDFNNGSAWSLGLNRYSRILKDRTFYLELQPLHEKDRVYFEDEPAKLAADKAELNAIQIIPEYQINLEIRNGVLKKY